MSNYLAVALGKDSSDFSRAISELENISGNPSEDVRLTSEQIVTCRQKIADLGLDTDDTTAEELYGALNHHLHHTSECFSRTTRGGPSSAVISDLLSHIETEGVWSPKSAFLKKALMTKPPKKLMKALHYRTAESLLKRENPSKVAAAAGLCESSSWLSSFEAYTKKAGPHDLQIGPVKVLVFDGPPWAEMPGNEPVEISCVSGAVIVRPAYASSTDALNFMLEIIQALDSLKGRSRLAALNLLDSRNLNTVESNSGEPLVEVGKLHLSVSAYKISEDSIDAEEKVDQEPSATMNASVWEQFCKLHPALGWWQNSSSLIYVDNAGEAVSLNLMDAAKNATENLGYHHRTLESGRRNLEDKLAGMYAPSQQLSGTEDTRSSGQRGFTSPQERLRQLQVRYGTAYGLGAAN